MADFGRATVLLGLLLLGGCHEYNYHNIVERAPDIETEPDFIEFDITQAGDSDQEEVLVRNVGNEDLRIGDLTFTGGNADIYSVADPGDDRLEPGEETTITLDFSPPGYAIWGDQFSIGSNDPDEDPVLIPILGIGSGPRIRIDPEEYTFSPEIIGCEDSATVKISNIGDLDLVVSDIRYFASVPSDLSLDQNLVANQSLPWTISPGDWRNVIVHYSPLDALDDYAVMEVDSNDPEKPTATGIQEGSADPATLTVDEFEQEQDEEADILFVIDNSGSMSSHQTNLTINLPSFISTLDAASVDYQIGVITTDDPTLRGPLITPSLVDPLAEFTTQSMVGTWGSATEQGLEMGFQHLDSAGWLRPDAAFNIVYVSDEFDSSPQGYTDYSDQLLALKADPDDVAAHAIAGDYPSGCSDATFGAGYYEVVGATGGSFVSICSADWASNISALASLVVSKRVFNLSETPLEGSITVWVDGVEVTGWVYDPVVNAVVFDLADIPPAGADIVVEYGVTSECP